MKRREEEGREEKRREEEIDRGGVRVNDKGKGNEKRNIR